MYKNTASVEQQHGAAQVRHAENVVLKKLGWQSSPDIRTKFMYVFLEGCLSLSLTGWALALFAPLAAAPLFATCKRKTLFLVACLALGASYASYSYLVQQDIGLGAFATYLFYLLYKTLFLFFVCKMVIETSTIGELMSMLNGFRLPYPVVLALIIAFRFIPTILQEHQAIREAMQLRGIRTGIFGFLSHPLKYWEYLLLPLMSRASCLADELSASALTRGVESPEKRIRRLRKLGALDILLQLWGCICFVAMIALILYRSGYAYS